MNRNQHALARITRWWLASVAAGIALVPKIGVEAWEGHDWNEWKRVTTWKRPDLRSHQSGRRDLVPLLGGHGFRLGQISSAASWEERRVEIADTILPILGKPSDIRPMPVEAVVLGEEVLEDHIRRHLRIRSDSEDSIPAYLLLPKTLASPRVPALLCLHQTVAQGKEEPCGIQGDPELATALELVRRGYVCIVPDTIGFGERIPRGAQPYHDSIVFYRKHPEWSFFGKMIWDVSRIIDYVQTLPFVDPKRIGSIGHSHGAYGTLFAAAFEPRISLAIASCGFTPFRNDPTPDRWSHATALLPQLGFYLPDVASIPFDWQHVCSLMAPRPLYIWYSTRDSIFPGTENLDGLLKDVRAVYDLYGAGTAFAWQAFDGPHRFPRTARETTYGWLEQQWLHGSSAHMETGTGTPANPLLPNLPEAGPSSIDASEGAQTLKGTSAFFPPDVVARARSNAREHVWAAAIRDSLLAAAEPWMKLSDDDLWGLMFGNTIRRSWMVWSNGHCPSCGRPVPMYEWIIEAMRRPWKAQCPLCGEFFPKNDFEKFYRSGLDEEGVFEPTRADRSLLFNIEHPDISDPLRGFGVDDGEGYIAEGKRWRFIGAYLIYGQWKQAVLGGIRNLAAAHLVTGEPAYAHKAGVLLDRLADLYPTFDFQKEGVLYEGTARSGYVSTWHDACVEVRELAMAYDGVFAALAQDQALVNFLAAKAATHKLRNPKSSFAHIQRNIEERILRDTLRHRAKIESNYPSTDVTIGTIKTVLGGRSNRQEVTALLDEIIAQATAVDGVSGEKGIAGYSTIAPRTIADLLGHYARAAPEFINEAFKRHPKLHAMYRFHLDTWCLGQYYPRSGDTGSFAEKTPYYAALSFSRNPGISPSSYTFLWDLYEATGDEDFVRFLYAANGSSVEGLPYDLFATDPPGFQERVERVIADGGETIRLGSTNKTEWCLAILRAGEGEHARAAWLDYDSGGRHGHADGMNLGLFAKGLDLMPDFGYPPVQYGGWSAPRAVWYTHTAAHNTVGVDGQNTRTATGKTTLWFNGTGFCVVRASGPQLIGGEAYERTVAMIDMSGRDSYLVDIFRVSGGREHTRFLHSHFGEISTQGLNLVPSETTRFGELMRGFRKDSQPGGRWSVDWTIEDRLGLLSATKDLHLRYTDLTPDAEVEIAEGWVAVGLYGGTVDAWIPRVLVRRLAPEPPLDSTFVGVIEPYEGKSNIAEVRRLELQDSDGKISPETHVALEVRLVDGSSDLFLSVDRDRRLRQLPTRDGAPLTVESVLDEETHLRLEGEFCLVRMGPERRPSKVFLYHAKSFSLGDLLIRTKGEKAFLEINLNSEKPRVVRGSPNDLESIEVGGFTIWPK